MEQTINPPDLDDLLAESRDAVFSNLNCIQIGQIQKVNDDQTAEVKIQFLRQLQDGKTAKYPLLVDCPYFVLNGGGSYIDMPIAQGDYCLVLFNDRNIDNWWDTANVAVPADTRKHSIADGMAIVGINPRSKAFARSGTDFRILGPEGSGISLEFKTTGKVILNAPGSFEVNGDTGIIGKLTVSGLIRGAVDIIADWAVTAIGLLTHFHQGNLGYPTGTPIETGGGTAPTTPPTTDADGDLITGSNAGSVSVENHDHDYTWTDPAGSGTTDPPN